MHKCSKCGKEFEGQFCPECGEKWVDQNACPKCGAVMDEGVAFCTVCGADLKGKKENGEAVVADGNVEESKTKKILSLVGVICMLSAALFGLIFTFCAGVTFTQDYGLGITEKDTHMIYYYFGDAFKNLEELEGINKIAVLGPRVLGALISVLGIAGVLAFGTVTVVRACKKFIKKQNLNVVGPAVGTFMSFAAMATLLLNFNVVSTKSFSVGFSAPTLAGLIMGGIALGAGAVLLLVANFNALKGAGKMVSFIMMAVACVLLIVILGLLGAPAVHLSSDNFRMDSSYGLFAGMESMVGGVTEDSIVGIFVLSTLGTLTAITIAVLAAVAIGKNLTAIANGKKRTNLGYGISILILVITFLMYAFLTKVVIVDAFLRDIMGVSDEHMDEAKDMFSSNFVAPIVMIVMSVIALAVVIVGKVFIKKYNLEDKKKGALPVNQQ